MTSLWQRLDDAYLAAFVAAMGEGSSYVDLKIITAEIAPAWNPSRHPLPALILVSDEGTGEHNGHTGAAAIRVAETLSYYAVAVAEATSYRTAKANAQELHRRLRAVLATWPNILAAANAAASTGEAPIRQKWNRHWIEVRGGQAGDHGKHYGIAVIAWTVEITA